MSDLGALVQLPVLWLAVLFQGGATLLWIDLLRTVPLGTAYPFAALGFVNVPAAGVLFLTKGSVFGYVTGAALIVLGVLIIVRA